MFFMKNRTSLSLKHMEIIYWNYSFKKALPLYELKVKCVLIKCGYSLPQNFPTFYKKISKAKDKSTLQ